MIHKRGESWRAGWSKMDLRELLRARECFNHTIAEWVAESWVGDDGTGDAG